MEGGEGRDRFILSSVLESVKSSSGAVSIQHRMDDLVKWDGEVVGTTGYLSPGRINLHADCFDLPYLSTLRYLTFTSFLSLLSSSIANPCTLC